tara:strand:- start:176 stop:727 length:552 start_codon:yes stop_codon:yes gene_type:complete
MALKSTKVLQGSGGHHGVVQIDEKELSQIIKDLDKLFPSSDTKLRNSLRGSMRKTMKPVQNYLRGLIDPRKNKKAKKIRNKKGGRPGQLKRSIQIINGKTSRGRFPSVYVGPKVKGGSFKNMDKSGFYFYFWEYGHFNPITGKYEPPKRWLDKTAQAKGAEVTSRLVADIKSMIGKRFAKKMS